MRNLEEPGLAQALFQRFVRIVANQQAPAQRIDFHLRHPRYLLQPGGDFREPDAVLALFQYFEAKPARQAVDDLSLGRHQWLPPLSPTASPIVSAPHLITPVNWFIIVPPDSHAQAPASPERSDHALLRQP